MQNRLGSNSLIDLVVFGRAVGKRVPEIVKAGRNAENRCPLAMKTWRLVALDKARYADGAISTADLRLEMQRNMQTNCAVFRTNEVLEEGQKKIDDIAGRLGDVKTTGPFAGVEQ